ncbi:XdhC family protein [Hymenobacter mucosus]|uniref:Xanthine and CO dehydrogenase maturation factor, XdhC/CoxF family n=1 Tax=Hymenobacter mucosus TaxID=1411120 RepID=A0A238VIL7_9BACT|nr:XdhC/CoxI family protein [Hymenobacter mucosus]SNR34021.1 Xanthine and CO dehydrogenase maturation factor, XdhC/CoxF family [Hymenobacter mucosus]
MTELERLLRAYDDHRTAGRACALASVVDVAGSAYRRPGARMLVTDEGQLTGAISGGCLEGDARQRARRTIQQGRPTVVTYDSTDPDDDLQFGAALGCQGIVQILLEPLDFTDPNNPVELLRRWASGVEELAVIATVFGVAGGGQDLHVGQRLLLTSAGIQGTLPTHANLYPHILADARGALAAGQPATRHYPAEAGTTRVSLEILRPPVRLTVYGAGNDVQPLVRLAASLGWRVQVVDGRPAQAQPTRFPDADEVRVLPLAQVADEPYDGSFALLMTHNYYYDLAVLQHLLPAANARYIGLLGPRKKYERLLDDLRKDVPDAAEQLRGRIHSPIGLNLGAETPEEIALSIIAEIQAVLTGRPAGFLRDSPHPIHPPLRTDAPLVAEGRVDAVCGL